jgi:hypothetical protein
MSRTLDARLSKMEKGIAAFGAIGPSYEDLLRIIREKLRGIVASPDAPVDEQDAARAKLASMDAEVWRAHGREQPLDIISALAHAKAAGLLAVTRTVNHRNGDEPTPKWCDLAQEWGLIGADYDPHPRIFLMETLIVSPPPRPIELSEARATVQ